MTGLDTAATATGGDRAPADRPDACGPTAPEPVHPERAPAFLTPLLRRLPRAEATALPGLGGRVPPADPARPRRPAAVLVLFGDDGPHGPDVLLLERAGSLREHAGQAAFPGGGTEPQDTGPVATALREAAEETGLAPGGVVPLAVLPELHVPPSGFVVRPVLAHWADPVAVRAVDPGETAVVVRVSLAGLVDPANRLRIRHSSGHLGPAFTAGGLLVWGFTGALLSGLLDLGGWAQPWDTGRVLSLDEGWSVARTAARSEGER